MAETLGSLCDKLTIVKLKQYHTEDIQRLQSLDKQAEQLQHEIDEYVADAVEGRIEFSKLSFSANKVYKQAGNEVGKVYGDLGDVFYKLADVNCRLWHEQEKVYDFESVPAGEKDQVVKKLALLNLERNNCIDAINDKFKSLIKK